MDKLIVCVIMALSLNAAITVQAYAQNTTIDGNDNGNDVVSSYTAFITAIGTLVGTIGA